MGRFEVCQNCKEPFSITEVGGSSGPRDREAINCPHCEAVWGYEKSAGVFATATLAPEAKEAV
jgi:predicted  nucleic acid-binding Zn ribbon protein